MTVSESLLQITELTKQNLQILKMLNDSFYTKSNHLSTVVGETAYTIPSYIALENKVNHVQDAINNLIHASKSGQAWFNFDGNSKEILVRGFQSSPNPISLSNTNVFKAETKYAFKDMLTPQPYLDFDMFALPDDINKVVVKKIIPYNTNLQTMILSQCPDMVDENIKAATGKLDWSVVVRTLGSGDPMFVSGVDYLEYESTYDLPIRKCTKSGSYVIESVISDLINDKLENIITVKINQNTPLTTIGFDGVKIDDLVAGDVLTTWDGSAKLKIQTIKPASMTLELLVISGEYVNPVGSGEVTIPDGKTIMDVVSDYSKLRLFSSVSDDRKLHVPLEEDQYVYITIAPLNERLNIQSEWGTGLFINVDSLSLEKEGGTNFRSYYNENVQNIGDSIIELANIQYPSITRYSGTEMTSMKSSPTLSEDTLKVVQINKHLNDSESVRNIRTLYSQKKQFQTDLSEVQSKIQSLNDELAQISFDDMSGTRSAYTAQIADLKEQQNKLVTSINKITENIAISANNAEIPIEAAKFRVRGYVDVDEFLNNIGDSDQLRQNVLAVQCRYRYKNPDIPQANVAVIGDNFLFTEWSLYNPPARERNMSYTDGKYNVTYNDLNADNTFNKSDNVNKFNQIDIPISQGEVVELQVRIIWGFGQPFATVATEWSNSVEMNFPPELVKDVQVTTIIAENNSDIETNRFENILINKGIIKHVDDSVNDQDVIYFHKPDSISSGFYTNERRIIPLKDKLQSMADDILEVQDLLKGTTSDAIKVSFVVDNVTTIIQPDVANTVQLPAYAGIKDIGTEIPTGTVYKQNDIVYAIGMINITNVSEHTVRLFSMFPASRDIFLSKIKNTRLNLDDFIDGSDGPHILSPGNEWDNPDEQRGNQIITYRRTNPYDSSIIGHKGDTYNNNSTMGLWVMPMINTMYGMCFDSDAVNSSKVLAPSETLSFPVQMRYKLATGSTKDNFTLGINIRNSLYTDPLYYQIDFEAKLMQSTADLINSAKVQIDSLTKYNTTVR